MFRSLNMLATHKKYVTRIKLYKTVKYRLYTIITIILYAQHNRGFFIIEILRTLAKIYLHEKIRRRIKLKLNPYIYFFVDEKNYRF